VVFGGIGDIFAEPFRRNKGICLIHTLKFHFGKCERSEFAVENIKFDRIFFQKRDLIAGLLDQKSVRFRGKMVIGFFGEREIIFFPREKSF
jgi:hypothetical protein